MPCAFLPRDMPHVKTGRVSPNEASGGRPGPYLQGMTMKRKPRGAASRDLCEVERAAALLHDAIRRLTRVNPGDAVHEEAAEDLQCMKPRLYEALARLEEIEGRRELTFEESSRRRAFRMLVEGTQ
jgi:hypothetical protein